MLVARLVLGVPGGYVAASGFVAALAAASPYAGLARSDAVLFASMLGIVAYLILLLWAFAEQRLWRLCVVFALLASIGVYLCRPSGLGS
jgi:hypothetical protein